MKRIGRLHVITDVVLQSRFSHAELARLAVAGGADTIQFRQKGGSTREMIQAAAGMREVCAAKGVPLIVNDRIDVAMAVHADGVHLGQDDFPIPLARELLGPDRIVGGSAGNLDEAGKCLREGADYVGFGPVYTTSSKEDAGPAGGLGLLKQVVEALPIPVVAIGGIDSRNVPLVMETGVHGIAVISAVCCREDPEKSAGELYRAIERHIRAVRT